MQIDVDLGTLGFSDGGHLLVKRALRTVGPGGSITVAGTSPELEIDLRAWCRDAGHTLRSSPSESGPRAHAVTITNGGAEMSRWSGAQRAGEADAGEPGAVVPHAPRRWGLAARGATVEAGAPEFDFHLVDKIEVWADDAARLYAQAVAAQWDPKTVIPWDAPFELDDDVEDAVVQIMTYLIENETAALIIPSRFIAQLHPHFREVMQLLAVQAADEARHIDVFTRRGLLKRTQLGRSTIGGQASLKTLVDESEFAIASFLLSVLGEGTFLSLLWFIERYAPDPVTAAVARFAAQDEGRHVAFGIAHLTQHLHNDPSYRPRLADAVRRRHDALQHTAGLNAEVFDALVLLAAGSWQPEDLREGHRRVMELTREMDEGRQRRLKRLGFDEAEAAELSGLHTRNFM
jgi:TusA-related sulfurtransferase